MGTLVSINGQHFDAENARVSVFDRGFLYGDSVFETLRTYAGRLDAVDEHLARLRASADLVGIRLPVSAAQLRQETAAALAAAGNDESHVRITITRGTGEPGLDPSLARDPLRVVIVRALRPPPATLYRDGVAAALLTWPRPSALLAGAKTGNYLANALALRFARQHGATEAILLTPEGSVLEATTSNVFLVSGGELITPALGEGILAGITRERVVHAARRAGTPVREVTVSTADLWTADEVFLTSSVREVVPVVRVDEHEVGDGRPGALTRSVHRALRLDVGAGSLPMPWDA